MDCIAQDSGKNWTIYNGDCCQVIKDIPDNSIGYSIFSPPFSSLYTYSDMAEDMGNCNSHEQFFDQFAYLTKELYRTIKPGRNISVHCCDIPRMKERDGYIGLYDFPGDIIRLFEKTGFVYHAKTLIWKDPLIEATRTKAIGLMHKQLQKDTAMCRHGIPDYFLTFRKPGENADPIEHPKGLIDYAGADTIDIPFGKIERSHHIWRKYASPVWMDIRQTNTLNEKQARDNEDERHICPLQLDVIERGITLWSNPDDVVFTPFLGIGSEIYKAILMGRKGIGIELKTTYYQYAVKYCQQAESEFERGKEKTLFG